VTRTFLGAALAALLYGVAAPAWAGPAMSWASAQFDEDQDSCIARAQNAFARDGWSGIQVSGDAGRAVYADKGPLTGLVLCLHHTAAIAIAGGEDGVATQARDRLWSSIAD